MLNALQKENTIGKTEPVCMQKSNNIWKPPSTFMTIVLCHLSGQFGTTQRKYPLAVHVIPAHCTGEKTTYTEKRRQNNAALNT